jgi:competence protein ComEA
MMDGVSKIRKILLAARTCPSAMRLAIGTGARRAAIIGLVIVSALAIAACVQRERIYSLSDRQANEMQSASAPSPAAGQTRPRININRASANELETLPGVGPGLAERIIEHREKFGPFRRPEHLLIVRGIGDKRFRVLQDLITVE